MKSRVPVLLAVLVAALVTGLTIRHATFVAWGTDTANYVTTAERWARADLFYPAPLQLWTEWRDVGVPVGARPSTVRGTDVSIYPPGFPIILAVGTLINAEFGMYLIAPLCAGLLVWSTFLVARRLAGPWAGVLAAAMMAVSPVALAHAITGMSDVPAAALVILAVAMSTRGSAMGAAASGAALTAAVMTRPILAPLGIVPAVLVLTCDVSRLAALREWQWKPLFLFLALAGLGPLIVGWSQLVLYGGFFTPGYPGWETFFSRERVLHNLFIYPRNVMLLHTPFVFLGLLYAVPLSFHLSKRDPRAARLAVGLIAVVLLNYAVHLPYLTYDNIWFTRFMLPAKAALFALLAGVTAHSAVAVARWFKPLAVVCVIPALFVMNGGRYLFPAVFTLADQWAHARIMGRYLDAVLPANAAIVSYLHSEAVAYYTRRQVIRFDLVDPPTLERLLDELVERGYRPVFLIDQEMEGLTYKMRFLGTKYERLDWRPRAQFFGATTIWFLDYADRDGSRDRLGIPRDILREFQK